MSSTRPRYSIVIPAYNEGCRIAWTVSETVAYFAASGESYEVILVDDGSTDDTVDNARFAIEEQPNLVLIEGGVNRGKGAAVRAGVLATRGELVLMTDADLATPYAELERLEAALRDGCAVAIGSRGLAGAQLVKRQSWVREMAGRCGNLLIRLMCPSLWNISDTQCGFKLFRGDVARSLFALQRLERYGFDVEILFLARRAGHSVVELPVIWSHGEGSKVRAVDYLYTLAEVAKIRLNSVAGKYTGKTLR